MTYWRSLCPVVGACWACILLCIYPTMWMLVCLLAVTTSPESYTPQVLCTYLEWLSRDIPSVVKLVGNLGHFKLHADADPVPDAVKDWSLNARRDCLTRFR